MKKIKILFYIFISTSIFYSCKKAPVACFTIDKPNASVYDTITCNASCSKDVDLFKWLIAGSAASSTSNTSTNKIKYSYPGTYLIKLEVRNGGKYDNTSQKVIVY